MSRHPPTLASVLQKPARKTHILLVDDDPSLRRALERSIRLAGFQVDAFASAEELLAQSVPSANLCLVLDVDLPGIDGVELKRKLDVLLRDVPAVFITALSPGEVRLRYAALSTATVLYKPFNRDDLLGAIEQASAKDSKSSFH